MTCGKFFVLGLFIAVVTVKKGELYVLLVVGWILAIVAVGGAVIMDVVGKTDRLAIVNVVNGDAGGVGGRGGGTGRGCP